MPVTFPESAWAAPRCADSAGSSRAMNLSSTVTSTQVKLCADWVKVASKPAQKPKPKTPIKKTITLKDPNGHPIVFINSVVASPDRPRINRSGPAQLIVGDVAKFRTGALQHSKYRILLGAPTEIRFTPARFFWTLSDGSKFSSRRFGHGFQVAGKVQVRLKVEYSIDFRVRLRGAYRSLSKTITLAANPTYVQVAKLLPPKRHLAYVAFGCRTKPDAWGC